MNTSYITDDSQINSQSFEDTQVGYTLQKYTLGKYTLELDNSKLGSTQHMLTLTGCQDHILTENIFVWSETSYGGDERRCYRCGTNKRTTKQTLKIELLSQWMLEAEFRKNTCIYL